MRAIWNDVVLADSDSTVVVEGNHYFPAESLTTAHFVASETRTICPWKGVAHYYSIVTPTGTNPDAAWHYPSPKPAAAAIAGRVAFWRGVQIVP